MILMKLRNSVQTRVHGEKKERQSDQNILIIFLCFAFLDLLVSNYQFRISNQPRAVKSVT